MDIHVLLYNNVVQVGDEDITSQSNVQEGSTLASSPGTQVPHPINIDVNVYKASPREEKDYYDTSKKSDSESGDSEDESSSSGSSGSESEAVTQRSGILTRGSRDKRSRRSRGSRVTIKTPTECLCY